MALVVKNSPVKAGDKRCRFNPWFGKIKLQYFDHLMRRADSLEKSLMLGKIEGRRRRGQPRSRWLDSITDSMDMSLSDLCNMILDREG